MSTPEQPNFGEVSADFLAYENTLRGYVRYQVARRNLEPFVEGSPMQIIDVQGGSGPDTAWLAGLGHQVMLLEEDETQLRLAAERVYKLPPASGLRVIPQQGDLQNMQGYTGAFDMALCHGVAMYKPNPHEYIEQVASMVKPGGIVSILEKGFSGSYKRAVKEGMTPQDLHTFRNDQLIRNNLNREVYAFKPRELYDILHKNGLEILHWYGVRSMKADSDNRSIDEIEPSKLAGIVSIEYLIGASQKYRAQGQMLHFIARKPQIENEATSEEQLLS